MSSGRDSYDVVIIGGGIIGVSAAYYLAKEGLQVALLEGKKVASGSSYGNAGWISPSHAIPLPGPGVISKASRWLLDPESPFYIRPRVSFALIQWLYSFYRACGKEMALRTFGLKRELLLASLDLYSKIIEEEDINCSFAQNGVLIVCETEKGLYEACNDLETLEGLGGAGQVLLPDDIQERMPSLSSGFCGGIFFPEDAHLRPDSFLYGLASAAERFGAHIFNETEVLDFELKGGRIARITANRGEYVADQVVVAAGAWSGYLARRLGIKILLEAAKGYSITIERPSGYPNLPVMLAESKVGVTPMGNWLRFAGTLELAGLDFEINPSRVKAVWKAAKRHFAGIDASPRVETWRGFRPCAPDDLPYLGRTRKIENLVIATGNGMHGIGQGPITGHLVSQIIRDREPGFDLIPYSPERFQWGRGLV